MSIVCCLIHEMRDSRRLWYSSHLESTSCGAGESLQALLVGKSPWGKGRAQSTEGAEVTRTSYGVDPFLL